jgi:hypothetical protein
LVWDLRTPPERIYEEAAGNLKTQEQLRAAA